MGHAVVSKILDENSRPKTFYFGLLFEKDGKDAEQSMQERVYNHWDNSPSSPAKVRPRDAVPDPVLQVLAWQDSTAYFPESLLQKFATGTASHKKVLEMKESLESLFPPPARVTVEGRSVSVPPRATGRPDFTIEGGLQPIDPTRCVDLQILPVNSFNEPRLGGWCSLPATFLFALTWLQKAIHTLWCS